MLLPPDRDSERRQRIWSSFAEPLIDFVFDDESPESDFRRIGRIAIESEYTEKELAAIYWYEVFPAIAGSWIPVDPLDLSWLRRRIINKPVIGCILTFLFRPWWIWVGWDCWRKIKMGIEIERSNAKSDLGSLSLIKDIGNER